MVREGNVLAGEEREACCAAVSLGVSASLHEEKCRETASSGGGDVDLRKKTR